MTYDHMMVRLWALTALQDLDLPILYSTVYMWSRVWPATWVATVNWGVSPIASIMTVNIWIIWISSIKMEIKITQSYYIPVFHQDARKKLGKFIYEHWNCDSVGCRIWGMLYNGESHKCAPYADCAH